MKKYDVAAYVWPSYTGDEPRTRMFWPEGNGEWETVREAKALFEGHTWPRKPLWGYVNEADPAVMEKQIDEAVSHGVNVFIYDWYWYDHRPFLENCLDDGFLKSRNRGKMKFYLMWANHDANYTWDRRISCLHLPTYIWGGQADRKDFEIIGHRWIRDYFGRDEYYLIDGKPVIAIYDIQNFVSGLGGLTETKDAMEWLDAEAVKAGFKGVHFQLINWGNVSNVSGVDAGRTLSTADIVKYLPFLSLTHYQFCHFTRMGRDYGEICRDVEKEWEKIDGDFTLPYYPHVSIGWDNTPRFYDAVDAVTKNNTPDRFRAMLEKAKAYADAHDVRLVTINSWNEWTETSYLEPDDLYGYGYLDAVKAVFGAEN